MEEEELLKIINNYFEKEANVAEEGIRGAASQTMDDLRMIAQGATLNNADEIMAFLASLNPFSDTDYGTEVKKRREDIARIKEENPARATSMELGGAMIPSAIVAPFTSGGSFLANMGRSSLLGTGGGFAYGFGKGEGTEDKLAQGGINAVLGGTIGPATTAVTKGVQSLVTPFVDKFGRTVTRDIPKKVEDQLVEIISRLDPSGNIPKGELIDQVIDRISKGEIIGDMSEDTMTALAGWFNKNAQGGQQIIKDALEKRFKTKTGEAFTTIERDLAKNRSENLVIAANTNKKELLAQQSVAYEAIYNLPENQIASKNITSQVQDILNSNKEIREQVSKLISLDKNIDKLFTVNKNGTVKMLSGVDLRTAENVRKALADLRTSAMGSRNKNLGDAYDTLEKQLRASINEFSPEIKAVRSKWKSVMDGHESFQLGRGLLGKSSSDVEIIFNKAVDLGPEAVSGLRMGFAQSIRDKLETPSGASLVLRLDDLTKRERINLETLYPTDSINDAIKKISLAANAKKVIGPVLGGSKSGRVLEEQRNSPSNVLANTVSAFEAPLASAIRVANGLTNSMLAGRKMSKSQMNKVSELLVSEDPDLVRSALSDKRAMAKLRDKIFKLADFVTSTGANVGTLGALEGMSEVTKGTSALGLDILEAIRQ